MEQLDRDHPVPDTTVFDLRECRKGRRINKMCSSLKVEENRLAYKADEEAYMARYGLTEEEKRMVRARDWAGLNAAGGSIYYLLKLGFVLGIGLYRIGAQMRGQTFEQFLASRHGSGAR